MIIESVEYICFDDEKIDFNKMRDSLGRSIRLHERFNGYKVWQRYYMIDGKWSAHVDQDAFNKAFQYWKNYQVEKALLLDRIDEEIKPS